MGSRQLSSQEIADFREQVWSSGSELYRDMPWRQNTDPYWVLVSEIMLQQTQVDRVVPKFLAFLAAFPDIASLASAPLSAVLAQWSGLGYNRRAKFLHEAAKMVVDEYAGVFPDTLEGLMKLPGVGVNTAGAILAYSFNAPALFIETNVRTVYFNHFFQDEFDVKDTTIRQYLEQTIDREHPREWYWALMDYGSFLKRQGSAALSKSKHYKKQPPLKGSIREVRGFILKALAATPGHTMSLAALEADAPHDDRFKKALDGLVADGLVKKSAGAVHLAE